jgi:hypothetical protein
MQHAHVVRRVLEIGKWLAMGRALPVSLHPREGARAVPAVIGRYVPVTVNGVRYQIYTESAGWGRTCYAFTLPALTGGNFIA